jgi:glycosyltransferase involved in cell wall biosynthesis
MRPVKILRVIARLNIGGPAIQAIELSARLGYGAFETVLVSGVESPVEGNMLDLAARRGVRPVVLPGLGRSIRPGRDAATLVRLYRLIRRERPDIVHTHTAKAGTLGRLAARLARVPVVVHTFHGHVFRGYFSRPSTAAFIRIERFLGRFTDRIITLSPGLKVDLAGLGIAPPEKIAVIPLGFDLAPFLTSAGTEFRRELGVADEAKLVGIVGRLTPVKNHRLFLDVAARLAAARPDVFFVIVGDGELRRDLEKETVRLGLSKRTYFTGWRSDMPRVYSALDVVVLTSRNEGTPVTLIEAMAAGKPVVASRVGGVPDLIGPSDNGILADPSDASGFVGPLQSLIDDAALAEKMGEAGRRRVVKAYAIDRLVRDVTGLYLSLLRDKGLA